MPTHDENQMRRQARRHGYVIRKSRERKHVPNLDNHGDYMLLSSDTNFPVLGFRYDATLQDIDVFLKGEVA